MKRGAKRTEHHEEPDDGVPGDAADQRGATAASNPDKLEELTSLVKSLVVSQASRDERMDKEMTRQEQKWRGLQHQFTQIQAQSDAISKSELAKFKITSELVSNGVQIYQFPTDDKSVAEINSTMNSHLPFAVVGSTEEVKIGNKMVKARQYPWGTVQVENENHCDFVKLQWLNRMKDTNTRLTGWYLSLQPYNFAVQYRAGKDNLVADCLSRVHED
ncbi:Septin-6 [Larimichthys crocea]|uniref:Septin-6 n=1 Tax=Larimichthys crocea TaxID=215358 RepID=A0A6G0I8Q8_LARCR|nr:Septin-6 [Larimichthys crocea]